jgi:GAF domain-containing protein
VLQVISSSPGDLQPVFEAMLEKAARICDATSGGIYRWDDNAFSLVATHNLPPAYAESRRFSPFRPSAKLPFGRIIATKAVVHIADMAAESIYIKERHPAFVAAIELGGVRTALLVPMLKENELIGSFALNRQEVRPFTDKQIALVQNFADQAVIAIENARLLNELRQRTDDLSQRTADLTESLEQQTATSEVLRVISSSPGELGPVFAAMLENAIRVCDGKSGNIYRWDGETLHLLAAHNSPPALVEHRRQTPYSPRPNAPMGRMIATKRLVHVVDAAADEAYLHQRDAGITAAVELGGIRTALYVPMLKESELIGVFTVFRQEVCPFTDKQIELVETFANQAVIAIENTRLLNELRQRTDDLAESLEQQTATSKVLDVISRSAFDLRAVFEAVVESSVRLCGADRATIFRFDGKMLRLASFYNASPQLVEWHEQHPIQPIPVAARAVPRSNTGLSTFPMSRPTPTTPIMGRKVLNCTTPCLPYPSSKAISCSVS